MKTHTFRRSARTGALINTDVNGYNQARLRKNLHKKMNEEQAAKNKEISTLKDRLQRLEKLVETLVD